ncbi:DDRGK domain-containing protein 1-like isoform X2 [Argiope bruennichi]|uniref:DDRGK domain-containing protein 1-like isoform X2 n=1 Tax=Argiope bruennichi TaxID=94029 RepID=UPI002494053D|nr:DDRGK domain-containing protein 1-like isoform X2 [Argiope bruennichi]
MSDPTLVIGVAILVVAVILAVVTYLSKKRPSPVINEAAQRPRPIPVLRGAGVEGPRRAGRNIRARMRAAASRNVDEEEEEEEDFLADDISVPEGKIGAKKRKKLELKAEKRRDRERELEEREERKQRQKEIEERKRKEELKQQEEEKKKEEEEKALKEEQERKEYEEYLKLKESFAIEEEGFDQEENADEGNKFQEFIDYIKSQKVVLMEDLASRFKLKTQEAIDRVQELLAQEWLVGVIDDRGKFIYITKEELEAVAHFIRQRGRVSIAELVECSNSLINLTPDSPETVQVSS